MHDKSKDTKMQRKSSKLPHDPRKEIFNKQSHTHLRRQLRKNPTEPERRLWAKIRNRQLGVKFRRQHGIGEYIVDFYCSECNLVIEIDGESHFSSDALANDAVRDRLLHELNLYVMRFTNREIIEDLNSVLSAIFEQVNSATTDRSKTKSAQC